MSDEIRIIHMAPRRLDTGAPVDHGDDVEELSASAPVTAPAPNPADVLTADQQAAVDAFLRRYRAEEAVTSDQRKVLSTLGVSVGDFIAFKNRKRG